MRKVVLLLFLSLLSGFMYAQEELALCLSMRDGSSVSFFLNEKPQISFVADSVKVVSTATLAKVKRSEVLDIKFKMEATNSIEEISEKGTFEIDGDFIRVANLKPSCIVKVFSVEGRVVMSQTADEDGSAVIPLVSLPQGVYLLNYNELTIKFIKQ